MSVVIIGGTGTLGKALLSRYESEESVSDVTVISRCELRQKETKRLFPWVKFMVGDITQPWEPWWPKADLVYNFAAMKHVELSEENVGACITQNLDGVRNFADYCMATGAVGVFTSTDKAVLPINAYGYAKGLSEAYLHCLNRQGCGRFYTFRWGNILGSRGSVLKMFAEGLAKGEVHVTDVRMTRFWADIADVVAFMMQSIGRYPVPPAKTLIPPMKASKVTELVEALSHVLGITNYVTKEIGIRQGEKLHECLFSSHESCVRSDTAEQYTRAELEELIQRSIHKGALNV